VGSAEGKRIALIELCLVPVRLGQGQHVGADSLQVLYPRGDPSCCSGLSRPPTNAGPWASPATALRVLERFLLEHTTAAVSLLDRLPPPRQRRHHPAATPRD
jgi:hypothetical protein